MHERWKLYKAPLAGVRAHKPLNLNRKCPEMETPNIVYKILLPEVLFLIDNILNDVENSQIRKIVSCGRIKAMNRIVRFQI